MPIGRGEGRRRLTSERNRRAEDVTEEFATLAREGESAVEAQRDTTADALQSFADTIQEKTGAMPGGDHTSEAGAAVAERLGKTADYVHRHNTRGIARRAQSVLQRQPIVAVVVGVVIGFVVGRLSK